MLPGQGWQAQMMAVSSKGAPGAAATPEPVPGTLSVHPGRPACSCQHPPPIGPPTRQVAALGPAGAGPCLQAPTKPLPAPMNPLYFPPIRHVARTTCALLAQPSAAGLSQVSVPAPAPIGALHLAKGVPAAERLVQLCRGQGCPHHTPRRPLAYGSITVSLVSRQCIVACLITCHRASRAQADDVLFLLSVVSGTLQKGMASQVLS